MDKLIPFRINYLSQRNYRKINEEKLSQYKKYYYEENKDKILEIKKYEYYDGNRKNTNIKSTKKIREENKKKLKYICEKCDYIADSKYKLERHFQSKKHQITL